MKVRKGMGILCKGPAKPETGPTRPPTYSLNKVGNRLVKLSLRDEVFAPGRLQWHNLGGTESYQLEKRGRDWRSESVAIPNKRAS